jgi:deazaflavin-dependent oxidoreductase (nitroreductase family)
MPSFFRMFLAIYVALYRLTGGRLGGKVMGNDVLLLKTIGRKSSKKRITPVMYLREGDSYVITATAAGAAKNPGWYWNAVKASHPVQIQVRDKVMTVSVKEAEGEQRDALYQRFIDSNASFAKYQENLARQIPVLILTPQP